MTRNRQPELGAPRSWHSVSLNGSFGTDHFSRLPRQSVYWLIILLLYAFCPIPVLAVAAAPALVSSRAPAAETLPPVDLISIPADRNLPADLAAQLGTVQRQTLRYFWDFAHPVSGLARERSNNTPNCCTSGGTGFGIMAWIVGVDRGWLPRREVVDRLQVMVDFLARADRFHGAWSHWIDGGTGKAIPFSPKDDGGDLVETSYLINGLLAARQYFSARDPIEHRLRDSITQLWREVEWDWYTRGLDKLFWHWSPKHGWAMNMPITGYNECLITFVLAASSPTHPIKPAVYHRGWTAGKEFKNGRTYFGHWTLPLGFDYGGPLFFAHYSFLGLDPRGLRDRYADYWQQNVAHSQINRLWCVRNACKYKGYSADCWGLTSSDDPKFYVAHNPKEDTGVISPTAALSSMPYTPIASLRALRHFLGPRRAQLWSEYGFVDAFRADNTWTAKSHLAIDQGPIVVMIENYRSALLWRMFMRDADVERGLRRLGFSSPHLH